MEKNEHNFVTKAELKQSEMILRKMMGNHTAKIKSDQQANYQQIIDKIDLMKKEFDPLLDMYKSAFTFGKWTKAGLTFLLLVGAFVYTFRNLIISLMNKVN